MPHHRRATVSGRITHVFAHRFVVETKDDDAILADVTPHGLDDVTLKAGLHVTLEGELKPSELKVETFTVNGKSIRIAPRPHHHHHDHGPADPEVALGSAREAGYAPVGTPRRKPKHFEVLGKRNGRFVELHIELDGHIRKSKPADPDEPKWREAQGR